MLTYALYLVLARRNREGGSLWTYVVPVYAIGGLACLALGLPWVSPLKAYAPREALYILGLALVPTVIGHTVLNASMRRLRGQVVSVIGMAEFAFSGVLAWLILAEKPSGLFYVAAALVVAGAALTVITGGPSGVAASEADAPGVRE
jgi:drug/metabolite transporter (DMT)-like permease